MRPRYIHTLNLARKFSQTIILLEGVLNLVLVNQSLVDSPKAIRAEPQSMSEKCHMIRQVDRPRQHIM